MQICQNLAEISVAMVISQMNLWYNFKFQNSVICVALGLKMIFSNIKDIKENLICQILEDFRLQESRLQL